MEDPINWAIRILWLNECFDPSTEFLHRQSLCLSECIVLHKGFRNDDMLPEKTHVSVVGDECSIAVMVILADNPVSLAIWHWFTCFRIETIGAIAEFSDDFVSTLPGLKVYGNPGASPGTPGGANILEYSSYGSKVPVNGPAESLIVLLNGL